MKNVWIVIGIVVTVAAGAYFFVKPGAPLEQSAEAKHQEWKRTAVEPETQVRPEYYEARKWTPESDASRLPASQDEKTKK